MDLPDTTYYVEPIAGDCYCGRPATHRLMRRARVELGARIPRPALVGSYCLDHAAAEAARLEAGPGGRRP